MTLAAAALAAGFAGQANALPSTDPLSGNGNLFLAVWNNAPTTGSAEQNYVRDLGISMNDFLANPTALSFAADALFNSTFASVSDANTFWAVGAGDFLNDDADGTTAPNFDYRLLSTVTTAASPTFSTVSLSNSAFTAGLNNIYNAITDFNDNYGCMGDASCAQNDNTVVSSWQFLQPGWGGAANLPHAAAQGSSMDFWRISQGIGGQNSGLVQTTRTEIGTGTLGQWALATDGTLTFSGATAAEVPVPAAVWLFGSGLLGLAGVARRNRKV